MENVEQINSLYRQSCASPLSAQDALTVPLKVLADLFGNVTLSAQLQAALALQEAPVPEAMSAVQRVHAAVRNLMRQGYRDKLTLKQLMLEMRMPVGDDPSDVSSIKTPEWQEPRWVGRTLRAEKLVDPSAREERRWLWGEQTRVVTLEPGLVADVLREFDV